MTDHHGRGHQHHRSGHTAEDEADKPQTHAIRHNVPLSHTPCCLPVDKTRGPGIRFNRTATNRVGFAKKRRRSEAPPLFVPRVARAFAARQATVIYALQHGIGAGNHTDGTPVDRARQ